MKKIAFGAIAFLMISCERYSTQLKPYQNVDNIANEKRQFILSTAGFESLDSLKNMKKSEIKKIFKNHVTSKVYDFEGNEIEGENAFLIDVVKEFKASKNNPEHRRYPVFIYVNQNDTSYVIPMAGNGLWGPVWGFVALGKDKNTVSGVAFDHKSETKGFGAEISEKSFQDMFTANPKMVMKEDKYMGLKVVKGGLKYPDHEVDAISGATITSNGVSMMLKNVFMPYMKAWKKLK